MGHAVAGAFKDQQVAMVDQAVNHGGGHLLVGEYTSPLAELDVGGEDEALALIRAGDDAEKQLRPLLVHGHVTPLIKADEILGLHGS